MWRYRSMGLYNSQLLTLLGNNTTSIYIKLIVGSMQKIVFHNQLFLTALLCALGAKKNPNRETKGATLNHKLVYIFTSRKNKFLIHGIRSYRCVCSCCSCYCFAHSSFSLALQAKECTGYIPYNLLPYWGHHVLYQLNYLGY